MIKNSREYNRNWRKANQEKIKEWRKANQEKIRENHRKWSKANPEKVREYGRTLRQREPWLSTHRLRRVEIEGLFAFQGGRCGNPECGKKLNLENRRETTIDHWHECCKGNGRGVGKQSCGRCVRAILCASCNRADMLGVDYKKMFELLGGRIFPLHSSKGNSDER